MSELLPPVVAFLGANTTEYTAAMGAAQGQMVALEATSKKSMGGVGQAISTASKGAMVGVAALGVAATAVALKSADTFTSVGKDVLKLQRYTGESAEEMSILRFAAQQTGIDVDKVAKGFGLLSKKLESGIDTYAEWGVVSRDTRGEMLPMSDLLGNLAERFEKMPNGPEKTALAMQIFGRAGADLIPLLNKGRDGLAELSAEAEKYGLVLSQDNLDAVKASTAAARDQEAAWQGLQVQIGQYVLPVLTTVTQWFATHLPPAIQFVSKIMRDDVGPVLEFVSGWFTKIADVAGAYLVPVLGMLAGGAGIMAVVGAVSALVAVLLTPATLIALLVGGLIYAYNHFTAFRDVVDGVVAWLWARALVIWDEIRARAEAAFVWLRDNVPPIWDRVRAAAAEAVDWLREHVPPVWDRIREAADQAVTWLRDNVPPVWDRIKEVVSGVVTWLEDHVPAAFDKVKTAVSGASDWIRDRLPSAWASAKDGAASSSDWIRTNVPAAWEAAKAGVQSAVEWIATNVAPKVAAFIDNVRGYISDFRGWWDENWGAIREAVGHVFEALKTVVEANLAPIVAVFIVLRDAWVTVQDEILAVVQRVWDEIGSQIGFAVDFVRGVIETVINLINGDWSKAWESAKGALGAVVDGLKGLLGMVWDIGYQIVGAITELAMKWGGAILGWVIDAAAQAPGKLWEVGLAIGAWILTEAVPWIAQKSGEMSVAIMSWIWTTTMSLPGKLWSIAAGIGSWIVDVAAPEVGRKASEIATSMMAWITGMPSRIRDAASGMWDGLTGAFKAAVNAIIRTWNNLSLTVPSVDAFGVTLGGFTVPTPDIPLIPMAQGGWGTVTSPTLFLAGEAGTEDFAFGPHAKGGLGGNVVNNYYEVNVPGYLGDRHELTAAITDGIRQAEREAA